MFLFYFQHNDLHASWNDYYNKFRWEHPSSHSYNIKEIEKNFVLKWWELLDLILTSIYKPLSIYVLIYIYRVVHYIPYIYLSCNWDFVHFEEPSSNCPFPTPSNSGNENLISFLWVCFWSTIDLQHYVKFLLYNIVMWHFYISNAHHGKSSYHLSLYKKILHNHYYLPILYIIFKILAFIEI